jgi:hypothetical protein
MQYVARIVIQTLNRRDLWGKSAGDQENVHPPRVHRLRLYRIVVTTVPANIKDSHDSGGFSVPYRRFSLQQVCAHFSPT